MKGKYSGLLALLNDDGRTFREKMADLSPGEVGSVLAARGKPKEVPTFAEHYFTMVGRQDPTGNYTVDLIDNQSQGNAGMVEFDTEQVIQRHMEHGDVVGWFHTHPPGAHGMSQMDVRCFTGWVIALTNLRNPIPRYAVILCEGVVHAWRLTLDGVRLNAERCRALILEDGRIRIQG